MCAVVDSVVRVPGLCSSHCRPSALELGCISQPRLPGPSVDSPVSLGGTVGERCGLGFSQGCRGWTC